MEATSPRRNRGPAAAAENHQALIDAGRRLFAERGYDVPLSAIAREANVSQGVLYRHFRTRLDLALAAFEDDLAGLADLAASTEADGFQRLWSHLLDLTVRQAPLVAMVLATRPTPEQLEEYDGWQRLAELIEPSLARATAAGLVDPLLTTDDVLLAQRMAYGIVVTSLEDPVATRATIDRALGTFRHPLAPA